MRGGPGSSSGTDVLGIGLNATDTVLLTSVYPDYAGKAAFDSEFISPGGQVATAMVACARLGLRVKYIGTIGSDPRGTLQRESLEGTGIDASGVIVRANCPNQTAYIVVDTRTGERTVLWQRAECLRLRPEEIDAAAVRNARMLHIDGCDTEAAAYASSIARQHGVPVSLDVDTVYPEFERVLRNVDYLVASSNWVRDWSGEADALVALPRLAGEYGCRVAAMTLGDGGSLAFEKGKWYHSAAFDVAAVDTTGAGDVFHGAFCYGVLAGFAMEALLDFANAAAALNCTGYGARGHVPALAEVEQVLAGPSPRKAAGEYGLRVAELRRGTAAHH